MRAMIALAATAGFLALGSSGASAGPPQPAGVQAGGQAAIQNADWYCGPRCNYWHHRHWEERHWSGSYRPYYEHHHWQQYGYYHSYRYHPYGYAY